MKRTIVIDSDADNQVDDLFAIAYALKSEELNVAAIYAAPFINQKVFSKKAGMEKSYKIIKELVCKLNVSTPVLRGSEDSLVSIDFSNPSEAVTDIINRSKKSKLIIVSIGALTNIAAAIKISQEIEENLEIYWLGGNKKPVPSLTEFNYYQDIPAYLAVKNSNVHLTIIPCWGVASAFSFNRKKLLKRLERSEVGRTLKSYLIKDFVSLISRYKIIWDVVAVGAVLDGFVLVGGKGVANKIRVRALKKDFYKKLGL